MNWTLEQLRHFAAAAARFVLGGARQLGKAQSAVSTAVGLLEADLGVELFDRSRRNATLTPAGEVLLQEALELLRQADGLQQRALSFASGQEARLSVALDEALPSLVLADLAKEIAERFPALELTQLNGTATEVADYVAAGRASLGCHLDRGDPGPAFAERYLGRVAQGVFVSRSHPLAGLARATRADLARHRQLVIKMEGVDERVLSPMVWRADSFYSIASMAVDGLGWAILPLNIAEYEVYRDQLASVPCAGLALPPLSVRALWLQGAEPAPPPAGSWGVWNSCCAPAASGSLRPTPDARLATRTAHGRRATRTSGRLAIH